MSESLSVIDPLQVAAAASNEPRGSTSGQRWRRRYGIPAVGAAIVVAWILVALLAPVLAPYRPDVVDVSQRLLAPSVAHWLGTDTLGRDVLSRLIYGARVSLFVSIAVVLVGLVMFNKTQRTCVDIL